MTYSAFMPHICPNCIFCGFPLDKCICGGVQAFGKYGVELGDWKELKRVMAEAWYIFQLEMSTMTNAPTIIPNTPTNKPLKDSDSYPRVDMRMQKSLPDFKLIPNLPDHLHIQPEGTHECIPRAIAFMLELKKQKGFNYDKTFTDLKKIAENENYDLEKAGIPFVPPTRIENLYQKYNVTSWPLNESSIKNFIDKGMPVAIGVLKANPHSKENHMVTVIGYDTEYFYVAAGNVEGSANMIPIADIRDGDKRGKWFSSNLYYIE
ncbi:MAG: hypothetical protein Q4E68_04200 [Prevotellaceae bacterium]|nr:hypothetical protein [Prevotellaceae bacterium]